MGLTSMSSGRATSWLEQSGGREAMPRGRLHRVLQAMEEFGFTLQDTGSVEGF